MAADTRPFKSKEQDGQGNEVIIRDQQLVEQVSQTAMASGEYFEIVDVDGRMAKIPKANMMSIVLEAIRLLLDDSGSNISAAKLTKILGLSASSIGNILPTDLASVLGVDGTFGCKQYILNHVGQVTLEGAFGWNNGQAIIDIINGANGIVVDRYVISPSVMVGSQFTEGIIRVYNKGTRSARVFYSIGSSKSKVTFQIDNGIIFARVITNDSLAISTSGTDISSMSEKTF